MSSRNPCGAFPRRMTTLGSLCLSGFRLDLAIADSCAITSPPSYFCDGNGIADSCKIESKTATDLDGHPRILCGTVDIGAYEFGIGDYDCNQSVTLDDFMNWESCTTGPVTSFFASPLTKGGYRGVDPRELKFAARQGAQSPPYTPSCSAFDFDADGDIDLADFAAFQRVLIER